jgi:hypothetical protein
MGLYDAAYKVLRINTTALELESVGANFGTINCGGAVMRRTDFRINGVSEIEYTRLITELSTGQGSADLSKSIPTNVVNTAQVQLSGTNTLTTVTGVTTVSTVSAVTAASLNGTTTNGASTYFSLVSVATSSNLTQIKSGATVINSLDVTNLSATTRYFKIYNTLAGSVVLGTTPAILNYAIPAGVSKNIDVGAYEIRFATALSFAITTGSALTDNTNAGTAAGDVIVNATFY